MKQKKRLKALAKAVREYIDSEDEDRIKEFDAMLSALVKAERAICKADNE